VADWHLAELDDELRPTGWTIASVDAGDGYRSSGTWDVVRGATRHRLVFEGVTESGDPLPVERAYGCRLDGTDVSLYLGKKTGGAWRRDLEGFVAALSPTREAQ
jgi:hypothetical protein